MFEEFLYWSSWYRYVLNTLTGGNFLRTSALEACNLIESLVGTPPTKDIKTEITLEDVIKKLDSMEKNLPNFLDNISKINESVVSIGETSDTQVTQGNRIGELEEAMETLSSTFSSLNSKREKAFVAKDHKFIYVPKMPKPRPSNMFKINKTFSTINGDLHNGTSSGLPKFPIVGSCVVEEVIDLDAPSSFGNT